MKGGADRVGIRWIEDQLEGYKRVETDGDRVEVGGHRGTGGKMKD